MQIPIANIQIKKGRRKLDVNHVQELVNSIQELGLLNPLTIDEKNVLIAGLHRLEAIKRLGWTEVECMVSHLEGLQAELAEIDENIVRSGLSALEYGEILLRRKEIYERLYPETKNGGDRKSEEIRTSTCRSDKIKSFAQDTAEKLGVGKRTIERQIQIAKKLTPKAKEVIRDTNTKLSKREVMKLSRLEPEQQKEAATLLAAKEIKMVEEYTTKMEKSAKDFPQKTESQSVHTEVLKKGQESEQQSTPYKENPISLKTLVAELKDPNKDCSGTPDSFLEEYAAFVRKFHKEMEWYSNPYYDMVYPLFNQSQIAILRDMTDSLCAAAEELFHKVERTRKI